MENNLNRKGISSYAQRFAKKTTSLAFKDNNRISGESILKVSSIKQVNYFVLKNLFEEWQKEASKLKSPYFDYDHISVQEALKDFMNILSKHISIKKTDFFPLLKSAVEEALLLIFSPYDFYTHLNDKNPEDFRLQHLKDVSKYVKVNKKLLLELIVHMENKDIESVNTSQFSTLLSETFNSIDEAPEDIGDYLDDFSSIEPLKEGDIYIEEEEEEIIPTPVKSAQPEEKSEYLILNDQLAEEQKPNLADIHRAQKISDLKNHLSINQRFMFTNALFEGDESLFSKTIDRIESMSDSKSAERYVMDNFPNWDIGSEEVAEFMELIDRRLP